jgi:hypothetical protein
MKSKFRAMINSFSIRQALRGSLLVPAIYLLSLLVTNPLGNFPLNDDWTYGKSVLWLVNDGIYNVGISAASLWTHIYWGALFVKIFGFSFNVLRASTIVATIIGAVYIYKLFRKMDCGRLTSQAGTAVIIFNPIFYCLSLTFMTDVNFCVLLIICLYLAWKYWSDPRVSTLLLFFIFSTFLVLLRQFGLLIPISFIAGSLFQKEKRLKTILCAFGLTLLVAGIFLLYENYLASTSQGEIYQGSSKIKLMDPAFWGLIYGRMEQWLSIMLVQIICAAAPFLAIYFWPLIKTLKFFSIPFLLVGIALSYFWLGDKWFPMTNVFSNMSLGTETFYQTLSPEVNSSPFHTYSETFYHVLAVYKLIACFLCLSVVLMFTAALLTRKVGMYCTPMVFMALTFIGGYLLLLCVADGIFDRYHLPMIIALIVAFASLRLEAKAAWSVPFIIAFMYVSIAGTKDYFQINRIRWEAYRHLREDLKVPMGEINGGYEVNSWHEGQAFVFWDSFFLGAHNYLIQYRKEPGFSEYREYAFQRYFPYKKDKIYIFERDQKKQSSQ